MTVTATRTNRNANDLKKGILCPILETRYRHPGVPTLVVSDWSLVVFLTSDWIVVADCFCRIKKFVSSSAFYSFKTNYFAGWVVVVGGGGGGFFSDG